MPSTSSTQRVVKHRAKLRATAEGVERINKRGRSENRKHHLKVKRLKLEVAAYEKILGIEQTIRAIGTPRARPVYPPEEELRRMSMADLAEWKRRHRISERRRLSQERSRKNSVRSLEKRLVTLQDMGFLVNAADEDDLSGDSALSELPSSDSISKQGSTAARMPTWTKEAAEESDVARMRGALEEEEGERFTTNGAVSLRPDFASSEEVHPADGQDAAVDEDAYMVWLDTFVPAFRESNCSEKMDFAGMQELTDVILS